MSFDTIQSSYKRNKNNVFQGVIGIKKTSSSSYKNEQEACYEIKCGVNNGHTIANNLRRVVLSGIEGLAVVAMKLNDINHIFASISGIKENAMDIYIGLKEVIFKSKKENFEFGILDLKVESDEKGRIITAKDFKSDSLEVINPDAYICTLDSNSKIDLKIMVAKNLGYVPESQHDFQPYQPPGFIPVDSYFNSVINFKYEVEKDTSRNVIIDKVFVTIRTNGSMTPDQVFDEAKNRINELFSGLSDADVATKAQTIITEEKEEENNDEFLDSRIENLTELSVRSKNSLIRNEFITVRDLIDSSEAYLRSCIGLGDRSCREIKEFLCNNGLEFKGK